MPAIISSSYTCNGRKTLEGGKMGGALLGRVRCGAGKKAWS